LTIRDGSAGYVPLKLSQHSVLRGFHVSASRRVICDLEKLTSIKLGFVEITIALHEEVHLETGRKVDCVERSTPRYRICGDPWIHKEVALQTIHESTNAGCIEIDNNVGIHRLPRDAMHSTREGAAKVIAGAKILE